MTRIACLFAPLFTLAARLRSEPNLRGEAVAVCEGNGTAARIIAASRPARQSGIKSGMSLAQGRSIMPSLIARGRDITCERSAHETLIEVAWRLSPRIEATADNLVFADVSDMEALFPGEQGEHAMGSQTIRTAESLQLPIRVGIASNKLAARIASLLHDSPVVVKSGEEAEFLAPLPLACLQLEKRLATTLQKWGVQTVGDLAQLPADQVTTRLGEGGAAAHQAALGVDVRPLVPHRLPGILTEGMELEWPVVTIEPLLYAVRQSLEHLHQRLQAQELACSRLELELSLEPEGLDLHNIGLPSPTRDVDALLALIRLDIESRPPQAAVAAFRCLITPDLPRRGQLTLFGPEQVDPQKLATALTLLAARLGPDRVGSPQNVDGHRPERHDLVPFDPPPPPKTRENNAKVGCGLLAVRVLRPPVEIEVITDASRSGDNRIRLLSVSSVSKEKTRIQGLVKIASGPWRLEEGWWSDQPVEREYWDVELSDGGLYRIYRDRRTEGWFVDGMYD
jgi:protein ImuB